MYSRLATNLFNGCHGLERSASPLTLHDENLQHIPCEGTSLRTSFTSSPHMHGFIASRCMCHANMCHACMLQELARGPHSHRTAGELREGDGSVAGSVTVRGSHFGVTGPVETDSRIKRSEHPSLFRSARSGLIFEAAAFSVTRPHYCNAASCVRATGHGYCCGYGACRYEHTCGQQIGP